MKLMKLPPEISVAGIQDSNVFGAFLFHKFWHGFVLIMLHMIIYKVDCKIRITYA